MRKPIRFGKQIDDERGDVPKPMISREAQARRFAQLQEAAAIVEHLPKSGESLHAIMTGRYDLADTIAAVLQSVGECHIIRIATLAFGDRNAEAMLQWLDSKLVGNLRVLTSLFNRDHEREWFGQVKADLEARGSRLSAARSHCKVVCFDFGKTKYVIEGSANLRTNSNWEQFCMMESKALHDWHAGWIDEQIEKYEVNEAAKAERRRAKRKG